MRSKIKAIQLAAALMTLTLAADSALGFYDPSVSRWINRDPIVEHGSQMLWSRTKPARTFHVSLVIHLHAFVQNDVMNLVDPSGLAASPLVWHLCCMRLPTASLRCECQCVYAVDEEECRAACKDCWGGKGKPDPVTLCICLLKAEGYDEDNAKSICKGAKKGWEKITPPKPEEEPEVP